MRVFFLCCCLVVLWCFCLVSCAPWFVGCYGCLVVCGLGFRFRLFGVLLCWYVSVYSVGFIMLV